MSIDTTGILNALVSHAAASGHFERVNTHEPKNAPGNGLTACFWLQRLDFARARSGLAATTVLLTFSLRVYTNMIMDPQDAIDPRMLAAVDSLMAAYSGDFELGGTVANVDLLGAHSVGLSAEAGYLEQDGKYYREMTVTLPLIVNDLWTQVA